MTTLPQPGTTGLLDGQVALVVGATSGIGRAVALGLLQAGAAVVAFGRDEVKLAALAAEAAAGRDRFAYVQGSATNPTELRQAAEYAYERFGLLDTLICTVGVFDYYRTILDIEVEKLPEAFSEIMNTNVLSYLLAVRCTLPLLLRQPSVIILTLSTAAFYPEGGGILYGVSKFATRGLVTHLAYELAPRVRVNGVAPGGTVGTALRGLQVFDEAAVTVDSAPDRAERIRRSVPLQIVPAPEDHVWAYLYLASHRCSRVVTGTVIHTDGGRGVAGTVKVAHLVGEGA